MIVYSYGKLSWNLATNYMLILSMCDHFQMEWRNSSSTTDMFLRWYTQINLRDRPHIGHRLNDKLLRCDFASYNCCDDRLVNDGQIERVLRQSPLLNGGLYQRCMQLPFHYLCYEIAQSLLFFTLRIFTLNLRMIDKPKLHCTFSEILKNIWCYTKTYILPSCFFFF